MRDWREAVFQKPLTYRLGSSTVRLQSRLVAVLSVAAGIVVLYLLLRPSLLLLPPGGATLVCNTTYPLSRPLASSDGALRYRIAIVSDLDRASRQGDKWRSLLRHGHLSWNPRSLTADVSWDSDDVTLTSTLAQGGRGMELSELVVFDGRLLAVDDRTGVLYRLQGGRALPWAILADGDGDVDKGFKGEWMTVKDGHLYVGGLGKEWTTATGQLLNHNPQFVKRVDCAGAVQHVDWQWQYGRLRSSAGIAPPGYLIHEAAAWSRHRRQWVFLPRRASQLSYDDLEDERRGTNLILTADSSFSQLSSGRLGPLVVSRGFSSVKFVPDTEDRWLLALKSEEDSRANRTASYITVVSTEGQVALPETLIPGSVKFEGVEFV